MILKRLLGDLVRFRGAVAEITEMGRTQKFEIDLITGDVTLTVDGESRRLCVDVREYEGCVFERVGHEFESVPLSKYEVQILAKALPLAFSELRSESLREEIASTRRNR